jgi:hypothetical protein
MKITLCGSITYVHEMDTLKSELEKLGHSVMTPPTVVTDKDGGDIDALVQSKMRKEANHGETWMQDKKSELIHDHFKKVAWANAILVYNKEKNGIVNYIGANTLLEMGLAFYLHKKIFLYNPIPEISYKEEILGMKPEVLHSDITHIKI